MEYPSLVSHFRPISLCNVLVKFLSKIIVNRLRPFLKDIIAPTQCSFIPGRGTTDNIVIVQEAIHSFAKKTGRVGHLLLKIDLEKAYDRIDWDFLRWVLMDLGLPSVLVSLIMFCVTSTEIHFLWNGELNSYFKPSNTLIFVYDKVLSEPASPSSRTEYTGHRAIYLPPLVVGLVVYVYGQGEMSDCLPREKFQA